MSRENVEVVRRWIDAYNSGGLDAVVEPFWHEELEFWDPPNIPDTSRHVGERAVRSRIESFYEVGWDGQVWAEDLFEVGEEVVLVWRLLGQGVGTGVPLEIPVTFVILVEDGKLRRIRTYLSKAEALEAVALSE